MIHETKRHILTGIEWTTGGLAIAGGVALIARPDGSLLKADATTLRGTPFADWRLPGVILALLVGCGFLFAGYAQTRDKPWAWSLAVLAGLGLIAFEITEVAWIGFQPLEVLFVFVGAVVVWLALSEIRGGAVNGP